MGILDDALNSQDAKRSQRLSKEAQKSKIENNKIKEGTYRGIDLVDGTAKIQLDGQTNTTSGYKLITNAPLGDGDRVSIRPNGVGMPRADAKNVAPKIAAETAKQIRFLKMGFLVSTGTCSLNTSSVLRTAFLLGGTNFGAQYDYKNQNPRFKILSPITANFRYFNSLQTPDGGAAFGSGSLTTNIESPYFVYYLDISDLGNTQIKVNGQFFILINAFNARGEFIEPFNPKKDDFKDFDLTVRSYASLNGGAFSLVQSTSIKVTPNNFNNASGQFYPSITLFPNSFNGTTLRYYTEWSFA